MDQGVIRKTDIARLAGKGRFYAPARIAGQQYCELIESPPDIAYDFSNVKVPLKQVFLPQTEVLCAFDFDQVMELEAPDEPILVFGCRPCDARAIAQLDSVFGPENKGYADPYYMKRRENSVVISLACASPCATCFCAATGGGPAGTEGADLIAHDLARGHAAGGEALLFQAVSEKGRAFLQTHSSLFREPSQEVLQEVKRNIAAAEAVVSKAGDLGVDRLKEKMDPLFGDERWEELTVSCLGCGACTYLCPTCHCFDIADEARLYKGRRIRTWDSCQFALFTKHASGHNPRTNKKERLRQRFMHKFSYSVENIDTVLCVGCGRCITACPANLDIRDVIRSFAEETKRETVS